MIEENLSKALEAADRYRGEAETMRAEVRRANKGLMRLANKVSRLRSELDECRSQVEVALPRATGGIYLRRVVQALYGAMRCVAEAPAVLNEATGLVEVSISPDVHRGIREAVCEREEVADAS